MDNMGSAHPLVEVNVSFKFEVNPSISKGVIERTRIGSGPTDRQTDSYILWLGYNELINNEIIFIKYCEA